MKITLEIDDNIVGKVALLAHCYDKNNISKYFISGKHISEKLKEAEKGFPEEYEETLEEHDNDTFVIDEIGFGCWKSESWIYDPLKKYLKNNVKPRKEGDDENM